MTVVVQISCAFGCLWPSLLVCPKYTQVSSQSTLDKIGGARTLISHSWLNADFELGQYLMEVLQIHEDTIGSRTQIEKVSVLGATVNVVSALLCCSMDEASRQRLSNIFSA